MERNDAITTLEVLKANCSKHSRDYQALDYAVSSLKTDETYHLMYEGEDIYTKADLVAMLTDFLMDIEENTSINSNDSHEKNGKRLMRTEIIGMFEQKINSLKES